MRIVRSKLYKVMRLEELTKGGRLCLGEKIEGLSLGIRDWGEKVESAKN